MAERPDPRRLEKLLPETDGPDAAPERRLRGRSRWTITFVASLELAQQGEAMLEQEDSFAPILVHAGLADRGCSEDIWGARGTLVDGGVDTMQPGTQVIALHGQAASRFLPGMPSNREAVLDRPVNCHPDEALP